MPPKRQTLEELFVNDPDMLRVLESRKQTAYLKRMAELKGEKGDTPEKGVDYFTPEEIKAVSDYIRKNLKQEVTPVKGKDYFTEQEIEAFSKYILSQATPQKGIHYFDGKDGESIVGSQGEKGEKGDKGEDGKNITTDDARLLLQELLEDVQLGLPKKEVEELAKKHASAVHDKLNSRISNLRDMVERNYGGHGGSGGGSPSMVYDLSSFLDGITSSFTIPANTAIIGITCSNAPFTFRPTVDYTGSGTTTLTFTNQIDPSATLTAGSTLIIQYY